MVPQFRYSHAVQDAGDAWLGCPALQLPIMRSHAIPLQRNRSTPIRLISGRICLLRFRQQQYRPLRPRYPPPRPRPAELRESTNVATVRKCSNAVNIAPATNVFIHKNVHFLVTTVIDDTLGRIS